MTDNATTPEPAFRIGEIVRFRRARSLACHVVKRRYTGEWEYALTSIDTRREVGWQSESQLRAATTRRRVVR